MVLLLTAGLALAIIPALAAPASEAAPVTAVNVNGNIELNESYPYFLPGSNTHSATGTLGGDATAHFNASTGVLTLQGYSSGRVYAGASQSNKELTIKLIGTVVATSIYHEGSGGITITSDDSANSLTVNASSSDTQVRGIFCKGDVTLKGKAKVTVNATNSSTDSAVYCIDAAGVKVLGDAYLTAAAISSGDHGRARGLYSTSNPNNSTKAVFNTTGTISIDVSENTASTYACNGSITLTKAAKLTLKWKAMPVGGPFTAGITFDKSNFSVQSQNSGLIHSVVYTIIDITIDTTPPNLSDGTVKRTSNTEATIGFRTDEAGSAYYLVLTKGDPEPTSAKIKAEGTPFESITAGLNTDLEITLTEGAKDVYVIVEDAVGYISDPLKITVPVWEYIPSHGGGGLSGSMIVILVTIVVFSMSAAGLYIYWYVKIKP